MVAGFDSSTTAAWSDGSVDHCPVNASNWVRLRHNASPSKLTVLCCMDSGPTELRCFMSLVLFVDDQTFVAARGRDSVASSMQRIGPPQ